MVVLYMAPNTKDKARRSCGPWGEFYRADLQTVYSHTNTMYLIAACAGGTGATGLFGTKNLNPPWECHQRLAERLKHCVKPLHIVLAQ